MLNLITKLYEKKYGCQPKNEVESGKAPDAPKEPSSKEKDKKKENKRINEAYNLPAWLFNPLNEPEEVHFAIEADEKEKVQPVAAAAAEQDQKNVEVEIKT